MKQNPQIFSINDLILQYIRLAVFGYSFEKPTRWASGTDKPPYINNRRLVSDPDGRKVIRVLLPSLVENPSAIDYVYPIMNGGIAPAVLLALEIDKPLLMRSGSRYYALDLHLLKTFARCITSQKMRSANVIAGTIPLGIIFGIILAEQMSKNFLFVRKEPKDHGTGDQVEGLIYLNVDYNAVLIDPSSTHIDENRYTAIAIKALEDKNIEVLHTYHWIFNGLLEEVTSIKGKTIVGTEDTISTGESILKELMILMNLGATVLPISIFAYDLLSTVAKFAQYGLENKSLLNFRKLIDAYDEKGLLPTPDSKMLIGWFNNQATWGINNGFVKK